MNNLVSLNNNIFHHVVRCFNSQHGHASRIRTNQKVGLVFNEKTHCFQSYNQGYRKTGNN